MNGEKERKVIQGGLWGAVTIVLVWLVGLVDLTIPTEVAQALTVIFSITANWWTK